MLATHSHTKEGRKSLILNYDKCEPGYGMIKKITDRVESYYVDDFWPCHSLTNDEGF